MTAATLTDRHPAAVIDNSAAIAHLFACIARGERLLAVNRMERLLIRAQLQGMRDDLQKLTAAELRAAQKNEYYNGILGR